MESYVRSFEKTTGERKKQNGISEVKMNEFDNL